MKKIKKIVSVLLACVILSSIPGIGLLSPIVTFAFEWVAVDGVVYEKVYDYSVCDYVYNLVEGYVYDYVEGFVYRPNITVDDYYDTTLNPEVFELTIGSNTANVYGQIKENDVQPIIRNDRTMLPARFVAESLGATVEWDAENRAVIIKNDTVTMLIFIDSDIAEVNGTSVTLDSPAFIENDRTYTPVRFIAENLGANVEWVPETQTVVMSKPVVNTVNFADKLVIENFKSELEAGGMMTEYNAGAYGGMHLSGIVTAPSTVTDVLISSWSDYPFTQEEIMHDLERYPKIWKQEGFMPSDIKAPFELNCSHPVDFDEVGKKFYILLIGIDENCNAVGYAVLEEFIG